MEAGERARIESSLREFALKRLAADRYPDCSHRFRQWTCGPCGGLSLRPTIERHPGDRQGDFMGILWASCEECRVQERKLSVTSSPAAVEPLSCEQVRCGCGGEAFYVGGCERWEDWGFFDEGTVVAMCAACGALRDLVDTD